MRRKSSTLSAHDADLPPSDGRRRRSHDSQQRIVDAMLALVGVGHPTPSAEQVSERGGVGLRSVFRHFTDMESLHKAMSAVLTARLEHVARQAFTAPTWQGQLLELIERRSAVYEAMTPYLLAGQIHRARSTVLQANHAHFVSVLRRILLERLPTKPPLPRTTIEAIDLALSFEAWQRLRHDQNLRADAAKDVLRHLLAAILANHMTTH